MQDRKIKATAVKHKPFSRKYKVNLRFVLKILIVTLTISLFVLIGLFLGGY